MAVKIGDKIYRNEQEQVYQNMKDIEELKSKILESYYCIGELNTASIAVARNLTNVPENVEAGWLIDTVGNLFKITGSDENGLLIQFYSSIRGPQGEDGAAVNIDDSGTSLTKVWSSQKTKNYADGLIIKTDPSATPYDSKVYSAYLVDLWHSAGIAWTTTLPSDSKMSLGDVYIGSVQASASSNGDPKIKKGDLIIYVDGNLKASALYSVTNDRDENYDVPVTKVCDIGGGKSYTHNIKISSGTNDVNYHFNITIVNEDNTPFTYDTFTKWFEDKMTRGQHFKECSGCAHVYSTNYAIDGIALQTGTRYDLFYMSCYNIANGSWSDNVQMQILDSSAKWSMEDKVTE